MLHGVVGDWDADHAPDLWAPYAGTGDDVFSLDVAFVGDNGVDAAVPGLDVCNLGLAIEFCSKSFGRVGHGLVGAYAFDQAIGRVVHGPQDVFGEEGEYVPSLLGRNYLSLEAPGLAKADLTLEFLQALGSPGDLQPADLVEGALSIDLKGFEKLYGVLGRLRVELGGVYLEDEGGGVEVEPPVSGSGP